MYNWLKYVFSTMIMLWRISLLPKVTPAKGFQILDEANLKEVIEAM